MGEEAEDELRHSWDQGIEALEERGEWVSGLVGEDAEDEEGVAKSAHGRAAVLKDLVREGHDQVE